LRKIFGNGETLKRGVKKRGRVVEGKGGGAGFRPQGRGTIESFSPEWMETRRRGTHDGSEREVLPVSLNTPRLTTPLCHGW